MSPQMKSVYELTKKNATQEKTLPEYDFKNYAINIASNYKMNQSSIKLTKSITK